MAGPGGLDLVLGGSHVSLRGLHVPADRMRSDHAPFLLDASPSVPDIDLEVTVVSRLAADPSGERLHTIDGSWDLYRIESGFRLDVIDPGKPRLKTQVLLDPSFTRGRACVDVADWVLAELMNPTLQLLVMRELAATGAGLMLHALAVRHRGRGLLFVGPSGAGKSTLGRFYQARGAQVLCDECVVVRRSAAGWTLHGTPFHGEVFEVAPGPAPLAAVYLIRHYPEHVLDPAGPGDLSRLVVPQLFLPFWDAAALDTALATLAGLAQDVPPARLGFARSEDVVDFLDAALDAPSPARHAVQG